MARDDFNRDMGDYLKSRRVVERSNPFHAAKRFIGSKLSFTSKKAPEEELPLDIPQEQIDAVLAQGTVARSGLRKPAARTTPARPAPQTATESPSKERGSMGWLFNKKKQEDEDYEMDAATAQPAVDEDVKEVLKITFKWLKMMDADTLGEIKASPEFEKYKAVLDKYGLIKK